MAIALESVVKQLSDSGIIAPGKLANFVPPKAAPKDGEELLRELLKQNLLTKFQAQQCAAGRGKALILGNYILLDKIGAGGMGQVFKAEHRRMKRLVAIKMLPKALMSDPAAAARFQREVEAAAKLRHPNIVAADDADEANGVHFLVMEYIEGSDLSALVKKSGPLPMAKALQCILQAARGLEFAHAQGVIHRDIKPANLLLDKTGRIKILDMGLARLDAPGSDGAHQTELTGTGAVMGTVDYMAPEQALNTKRADARSDVYSLGCTLYYLLTGKQIYHGESVVEKLIAHREQPIPSLQAAQAGVPKAVEAVFAKMVAKNPDERYQTMSEVVAAIQSCGKQQASPAVQAAALPTAQALPETDPGIEAVTAIIDEPVRTTPRQRVGKKASGKAKSGSNAKSDSNTLIYGLAAAGALGVVALAGVFWMLRSGGQDAGPATAAATANAPPTDVSQPDAAAAGTAVGSNPAAAADPNFAKWLTETAALPGEQQVAAVAKKLQQLNPGFNGKVISNVQGGIVVEFTAVPDNITDISPVRAFPKVAALRFNGSSPGKSRLADLSPLRGMQLTRLTCGYTRVADLSPLKGMPLTMLFCALTQVSDVSPLAGMPLAELHVGGTPVVDLSPLRGMPLTTLTITSTSVNDLSPLAEMKLTSLDCGNTKVTDLSPLYGMPLVNLGIGGLPVADLTPFRNMRLTKLDCSGTQVSELGPLQGMPLATLWCGRTKVSDLSPLRGLPLADLACDDTKVSDLSPLAECRSLKRVNLSKTGVSPAGIAALHTALPGCKIEGDGPASAAAAPQPAAILGTSAATVPSPKPLVAPFDMAAAKAGQKAWARHLDTQVETTNKVGMKMILIPPGEFLMGSTDEQVADALTAADEMMADQGVKDRIPKAERPQHRVAIAKPFLLGETEVTVAQFRKFVNASKYSTEAEQYGFGHSSEKEISRAKDDAKGKNWRTPGYAISDELPVTQVTWNDAVIFCNWLSEREGLKLCYRRNGDTWFVAAGDGYRLPTEAEWEYACRAGTTTQYSFGDNWRELQGYGWFNQNSSGRPSAVALKLANTFGLYDMHGNLGEWCQDYYDEHWYSKAAPDDSGGQPAGSARVIRGGNWYDNGSHCRSASRYNLAPAYRLGNCGFRVASPVYATAPEAATTVTAKSDGPAIAAPPQPTATVAASGATLPPPNAAATPSHRSSEGRLPRPAPTARQTALEKLKAAHHDAWAEASDSVRRAKLIKELLHLAGTTSAADECFACYEGAVQLACDGGDLSRALAAIAEWSAAFDIDAHEAGAKAVEDVINGAKTPAQRKDLGLALLPVMEEQMAADRYDVADLVLTAALPLVAKVRDPAMTKEYKLREAEMQQWLKLWSAARDARAKLAESPGDAAAHAALGRYLCLARGEWSEGLPHLRQGSDELLAAAAKAELAGPVNADAQAEVGEAWWTVGEKEKTKSPVFPKLLWQDHAVQWISKSLAKLPAATKNKLKLRLSQFTQQRKSAGTIFTRRRPLDVTDTFGGHWYKFYGIATSWPDAKRRCESMGGHLVFVESSEENEFVKSLIVQGTAGDGDFRTWLGARAYAGDGRLLWLDGTQITFADWLNKNEADKASADSIDFYLGYWNGGAPTMGMRWFRQPERMTGYFVCEWDQ